MTFVVCLYLSEYIQNKFTKKVFIMRKVFFSSIIALSILAAPVFATPVFAGSADASQAEQANQGNKKKKSCFIKKFKKAYKVGKKAGTKIHDSVKNKIMDSGVAVKKAFTGKKNKVFVKGHYKANGQHVKGHWRTIRKNGKK